MKREKDEEVESIPWIISQMPAVAGAGLDRCQSSKTQTTSPM